MLLKFLALLLPFATIAATQAVPVDPIFDCSNPNFQVIYTACKAQDYTQCCAVGTDCCAGGCCDLLSTCVGIGTSQETCCDFSDTTNCGTGPSPPKPSVICTGSSGLSSYKCPPGSKCNIHNDSCYAAAGGGISSSAAVQSSQASSSLEAAPSSQAVQSPIPSAKSSSAALEPVATASESETQETVTSNGGAASVSVATASESETQETATSNGGAASVSVVTVSSAAQPTTSTQTGGGASASVVTVSASPTTTSSQGGGASKGTANLFILGVTGFALFVAWL